MADERQKQKWREARKRYFDKNRIKILAQNRERAKKKDAEDPLGREARNLKKRANGVGITKNQWEKMFDSQGRVCAICRSEISGHKKGWQLDHCHKTKKVRFILCTHCNRGLGGFRDSPELLRRAANALEAFNKNGLDDGKVE
jgi:hypothetical protein